LARAAPPRPVAAECLDAFTHPETQILLEHAARDRVSLGVQAVGSDRDQVIAGADPLLAQELRARHDTEREARKVVRPFRVGSGCSLVSPPSSAQPALRQASATPLVTCSKRSISSFAHA
jgi:hypothetical protein